jgi:hypothetical protein
MISGVVFQGGKFKDGLRERAQLEAESHAYLPNVKNALPPSARESAYEAPIFRIGHVSVPQAAADGMLRCPGQQQRLVAGIQRLVRKQAR